MINVTRYNKEKDKQIELENLKNIEDKFIEINKKVSGLDNLLKSHLKTQDIDTIKKDITEMKISLNTKISKEGLKEMYDIKDVYHYIINV